MTQTLQFGRFEITYDPSGDLPVTLYDDQDGLIDWWDDPQAARLDIDNSPVGEEITLEQWQALWDWVQYTCGNANSPWIPGISRKNAQ